ncbi:unnamed protein product [Bemisia tabaci]|uniref:Transcriptional regulator ATRX n=1 Tax=Bemisia tabaci TaxID=7038 RepID=A0A9P0ACM2_BEMTA|nr:unnamed protein product [Bemisia tabaci]
MEEKMDLNVSDSVMDQEAAQSSTVEIATSKMKISTEDIAISLQLFNKRLNEQLRPKIKSQRSLADVYASMKMFNSYYNDMQNYIESARDNFKRQLGIILGENWDQQLLCIENNPKSSSESHQNHGCVISETGPGNGLPNFPTQYEVRSICDVDEKTESKETSRSSSACAKEPQSFGSNDVDVKDKSGDYVNSDHPVSKGNINVSNSLESYDSSNDLPEAGPAKELTPDVLLPSSQGDFKSDSDKTAPHHPESNLPSSDTGEDKELHSDSGPRIVSVSTIENNGFNSLSGQKPLSQLESQMSESLLRNLSPILFAETSKDHNEFEGTEKSIEKAPSDVESEHNVIEATPVDVDQELERDNFILTPTSSKRRNEVDETSRKVYEWLNKSHNSESIGGSSDEEEYQAAKKCVDDDARTEINDADSSVKNSDNGDNIAVIDNSSLTSVDGRVSKTVKKKSGRTDDIIEISDDEQSASEVVESEKTAGHSDDVCEINSSQEIGGSMSIKDSARPDNHVSESSDTESKTEMANKKSKQNSNLNSRASSEKSMSNIATQQIHPENVDEAKRTLLESSCSSNEDVENGDHLSDDDWDSNATVIVDKKKKLRKKKRKKTSSHDSGSHSDKESSDEEEKVKKLLDFNSLKKRKRVFESSNSSSEKSADISNDENITKRKKKKKQKDEADVYDESLEPEINEPSLPNSPNRAEDQSKDIYRQMLLDSNSSPSSDEQCPLTPQPEKVPRKVKKTLENDIAKRRNSSEDSCKKKKKRKYDPLLQGKFSLSSSDSDGKKKKNPSEESEIYDRKYERLLEKQRRKEESKMRHKSSSDDCSDASASSKEQNNEPINFVSVDPECVELEDDSEDDRTTIGYHQISSSASDDNDDDVQCIPQSQETTASNKGRKNIRKVISVEEMTAESKRAAKEEEERQKRLSEKEKWLSQTFTEPEPEKLVLDADEETKQPIVTVHPGLMRILKKHQVEGLRFMWNSCFESIKLVNSSAGSGCVLAHCMGLGKSLQIVALVHTIMCHPQLNLRTVLIICPKTVVLNWGDEFKKWLRYIKDSDQSSPIISVSNLNAFKDVHFKERSLRDWQNKGGVMILGYNEFRALVTNKDRPENLQNVFNNIKNHLIDPGPDVVVYDEGHILKNNAASLTKAANLVKTKRRIVLTGTPMQNNLMEYYYMVNLVKPNYLGDKKEFSNRFFNPITNGQFQDSTPQDVRIMKNRTHVLHKKLHNIVQRFDANLFKDELPARYEYVLKLRMSELQSKLYKHFISSIKKDAEGHAEIEKNRLLLKSDKILGLICNHPKLATNFFDSAQKPEEQLNITGDWTDCLKGLNLDDVTLSPKTFLFFKVLKKCTENKDKLLVFSQHLKTLDLLEFFLKKASCNNSTFKSNSAKGETWISGVDYFRLDGSTPGPDRQKYCDIFNSNNPRARLFLLSTRAGALGLNLTGANRAIVFDVSWNPSSDSQSVFRIYRFGQVKPCYIYRFVMKGTMEEKKYHRQVSKLSMSSRVVDKHQVGRHYQEEYLRALFEYNFDYGQRSTPRLSQDKVLTELLINFDLIDTYEEHENLLMNLQDEELSEEDRLKAIAEYEAEINPPPPPPPPFPGSSGVSGPAGLQNPSISGVFSRPGGPFTAQEWTEKAKVWAKREETFFKKCYKDKKIPLPYMPLQPANKQAPETMSNSSAKLTGNSDKISEAKVNSHTCSDSDQIKSCNPTQDKDSQHQPLSYQSASSINGPNVNRKASVNPSSAVGTLQTDFKQPQTAVKNSSLPQTSSANDKNQVGSNPSPAFATSRADVNQAQKTIKSHSSLPTSDVNQSKTATTFHKFKRRLNGLSDRGFTVHCSPSQTSSANDQKQVRTNPSPPIATTQADVKRPQITIKNSSSLSTSSVKNASTLKTPIVLGSLDRSAETDSSLKQSRNEGRDGTMNEEGKKVKVPKVHLPQDFRNNVVKGIHAKQDTSNGAIGESTKTIPNLSQSKVNGKSNLNGNQIATTINSSSVKHGFSINPEIEVTVNRIPNEGNQPAFK